MSRDGRYGIGKKDQSEQVDYRDFWPSETSGDGKIVSNNLNNGAGQGKASFITKARCKICGYLLDVGQNDTTGGSLDGNGAGGGIATATVTSTFPNGTVYTEETGTQTYNVGAGCPLCFSKNSTDGQIDLSQNVQPFNSLPNTGF